MTVFWDGLFFIKSLLQSIKLLSQLFCILDEVFYNDLVFTSNQMKKKTKKL